MTAKLTQKLFALLLLLVPLSLWAASDLDYQNRGDRFEGVRPRPVSGYDIEVISALVDYHEPAEQLPDQLRVAFYLQGQAPVHLTVREQDYRLYYWLDRVKPAKDWQAKSVNEFTWPTGAVLRQLDQKLNLYELGVLIRLRKDTPASVEDIAPAILYHARPPEKVGGYLFTMKTNGDARLSCKVYREGEPAELMAQTFRRNPGGRPFTVRWDAGGAQEGYYRLVCNGYFLDTSQPLQQTVRFFHRSAVR
ncbi:MAG: hypothetical protein GDA65_03805 [Nitrospira sp. CR1.1]|nr:hypothetical protein [Nitrospira sp. CR1.1]